MSVQEMVRNQLIARGIRNESVLRAMGTVPREQFVLPEYRDLAYMDGPLPIHQGQTISQPYIVAAMTERLQLKPESRVLEIGTGCGYQTAVLATIAAEVFSVEIRAGLSEIAHKTLTRLGYSNIRLRIADGHFGWPEFAPYDGIIVTAAPGRVPQALRDQLKSGGRLVIPVGTAGDIQELRVIEKRAGGEMHDQPVMAVRFVPLIQEGSQE